MISYTVQYVNKNQQTILTQYAQNNIPYIAPVGSFVLIGQNRYETIAILYAPEISQVTVILK